MIQVGLSFPHTMKVAESDSPLSLTTGLYQLNGLLP